MASGREGVATRREFVALGAAASALGLLPGAAKLTHAQTVPAASGQMAAAIKDTIGTAKVTPGKVKLSVPALVENGNVVPVTIAVDSAMTETDYVKRIHLFNEKNPQPYVATFHLGPRAGKASVATRIRLADSQQVVAIAELADGSCWSDSADVIVTLAACLEQ